MKKNIQIKSTKSVKEAMQLLNRTGQNCIIVINDNKTMLGTLTDGDIRRGSKNYSDKTKITSLMTKKPLFVGENVSAEKALSIMSDKKITSLIVSSDLEGLYLNPLILGMTHIIKHKEPAIKPKNVIGSLIILLEKSKFKSIFNIFF